MKLLWVCSLVVGICYWWVVVLISIVCVLVLVLCNCI